LPCRFFYVRLAALQLPTRLPKEHLAPAWPSLTSPSSASSLSLDPQRNKHIMVDLGTGNNNKVNWAVEDDQELIDLIETVYRGASKGRGLVVSPKGALALSLRAHLVHSDLRLMFISSLQTTRPACGTRRRSRPPRSLSLRTAKTSVVTLPSCTRAPPHVSRETKATLPVFLALPGYTSASQRCHCASEAPPLSEASKAKRVGVMREKPASESKRREQKRGNESESAMLKPGSRAARRQREERSHLPSESAPRSS